MGLSISQSNMEYMANQLEEAQSILMDSHPIGADEFNDCCQSGIPGGSTPIQYGLPKGSMDLQDLIEYRNMNFAQGNIFKAVYRMGECNHSDMERDLNKIIWFANRELRRIDAVECAGNE